MKGGEAKLQLKAADQTEASNWEQHIYQRLDWLHHESELQLAADQYEEEREKERQQAGEVGVGAADKALVPVLFSGWLKKKSPKKYAGLQVSG